MTHLTRDELRLSAKDADWLEARLVEARAFNVLEFVKAMREPINAQRLAPANRRITDADRSYAASILDDLVHPYDDGDDAKEIVTQWVRKIRVECSLGGVNASAQLVALDLTRHAKALRYLADHDRPQGGQSNYNSEHLIQLACELESTTYSISAPRPAPEGGRVNMSGTDLMPMDEVRRVAATLDAKRESQEGNGS